jgi:hypothetical protein
VTCNNGECETRDACLPGRANCSGNASAGCATDITTADHCGDCKTQCSGAMPFCSVSGAFHACSATNNAMCFIGASCPAVDCPSCGLTCSAAGQCCLSQYTTCTNNDQCCPGLLCHLSSDTLQRFCEPPEAGDPCTGDVQCASAGAFCQKGACCLPVGKECAYVGCCDGLACQAVGYQNPNFMSCCVPMRSACKQTSDCCTIGSPVCQGGVCCIASGQMGCGSNLDCCPGSTGCVGGVCK